MSHSTDVEPILFVFADLFAAIADLRLAQREVKELRTASGKTHQVDMVVDGPHGRQIGFQKAKEGHYQPVLDCDGLTEAQKQDQQKTVNQIVQRYAYRRVVQELQAKGYTVAQEEKQADSSIRLVLSKWS